MVLIVLEHYSIIWIFTKFCKWLILCFHVEVYRNSDKSIIFWQGNFLMPPILSWCSNHDALKANLPLCMTVTMHMLLCHNVINFKWHPNLTFLVLFYMQFKFWILHIVWNEYWNVLCLWKPLIKMIETEMAHQHSKAAHMCCSTSWHSAP